MYSLLEALPSPEEIVLRAKELGQNAVALTDKGAGYGLVEFYQYAQKHGIKPILGMSVFVAARTRHDKESGVDTKSYQLTLLARDNQGYQNLLSLATEAALDGMYYKPRVDAELLTKYGQGLIALTGPLTAAIPQAALAEDGERIKALTAQYRSFFGEENLYFELMDLPNVAGQAEVNQQLIKWGKELGVPVVATSNAYYCRPEDAEAHDVLLCIQKNANVHDPGRFSMRDADYSMRPFEQLEAAFAHVPEALENTRVIADRCSVTLEFGKHQIPTFPTPDGQSEGAYLRELCEKGFAVRYPNASKEAVERLNYELSVIDQMGFSGYFLIVQDFVNEAKRRGITVGPGRGSAAGSMVSYCLDITTLDPLEHGLLFERFLNPERISLPDIDTDFADTRRDEILEYVRAKYGTDRVVQICTFGTLAARAAVKDVGRAYGVPFLEMNALAKLIPERPGTKLKEALETDELKAVYDSNELYRRVIDIALKLEGKTRHVSIHACGVVITPKPTTEYTAVQRAPKDENIIITQYSAKPLESLGLLKMDFLGLMNLTVIQTTLENIRKTRGLEVDIAKIPLDDKETFALLQRGETTGVFQFESGGMRRYLKQLKPTEFNDITAMAALYRPGPMEWIPSYIKRKHGKEKIAYLHPDLEPIFRETYGIGVYQEQILQLARTFAGYSLGEADLLRRAIGKKIKKELDAQREKFVDGAVAKGYEGKLAEQIFDDVIMPFAGYGFVKAHAAGYARIAYETAYLKANFPAEFMAALLSADAQDTDRVMIEIEECRSMGLEVLPPDVNESGLNFTVVKGADGKEAIRFGLAAVKGVGESSVGQLIAEREAGGRFATIEDFAKRVPAKILNKKLIESLGKAGAFDALGERKLIVENYQSIVDFGKETGDSGSGQASLLDGLDDAMGEAKIEFPATAAATPQEILAWEKETLGLYVSSHPLAGLKKYISRKASLIANLEQKDIGKKVTLAGIQEGIKKIRTKKGETMVIVFLEDPTGKIEVTVFPRLYAEVAGILEQPDTVLVVAGTLDLRGGQLQMRADAMKKSSLSAMIKRAKDDGVYDAEEAKRGITLVKKTFETDEEELEMVDEEGNIIAGETVKLGGGGGDGDEFLGALGKWIVAGMQPEPLPDNSTPPPVLQTPAPAPAAEEEEAPPPPDDIPEARTPGSHVIPLPARAPKQLLLDLKSLFQATPGPDKVALDIGGQTIPVPLTVAFTPALQERIGALIEKHTVGA